MKHCPQCTTGYPDNLASCPVHGLLLNEIRDLKPGMVIHHSYRIVRKLGHGGMGAVYLAQHTLMNEPRALKFLSPELGSDKAFTDRFLREVRTLRQIRNRNVIDCGDLESAEDGSLFFSMEYVDGPDLRDFLNNAPKPFDVQLALGLARGIAEGLGAAHAKGMVHRDIKPENILMANDAGGWLPKIADFGIVATKESSTVYTRTGGTLLTMAYAAPEQWRGTPGAELDGRTDLYALGGLFYEMLTGCTPFQAENYEGWSLQHQTALPQSPSALRPDLADWQGLDAMVLRLLAKDREERPKDVAELLRLLDAVVYLTPEAHRETIEGRLRSRAAELLRSRGFRRVPRWAWISSASAMALAVVIGGLAAGLSPPRIARAAFELDGAHHFGFGGVLRNLACTRGDEEECWSLGEMFESGNGVPTNSSRARSLYAKACEGGSERGCQALGFMYYFGTEVALDKTRAEELFSKACGAGEKRQCQGIMMLGNDYEDGFVVNQDSSRAMALYSVACKDGEAGGCTSLGRMYWGGKGVAKDGFRAASQFSKACDGGDADGCANLGDCYRFGIGVEMDSEKARQLLIKGCDMGSQWGCDRLKEMQ